MILSDTAVKRSTSVIVLSAIILVIGLYSYFALPRESAPDVTIPYVFITTEYKGVSPADIETSITIPIEKKLKGLEGVKRIHSISSEGLSAINVEFVTGTDIDDALEKVRNKVDEAGNELPRDLENDPSVFEVNISELPIVTFSLSGTCGKPCLKNIADELEDDIESIPGVLDAIVTGGVEREIRIEVSPEKLAYYGIPITALQGVVQSENVNTSGGIIRLGDGRYQLRVPGEFKSPEELYGLVVGSRQGRPVYLKDLAAVVDDYKEETSRSRLNGEEAVSIAVKKRAGENIIKITELIDEVIERNRAAWPEGVRVTKLMDMARDIRLMVADLENNMLSGLALVVAVTFFALGMRNAVLVSMAIPFSMFISFAVLYAMGITLNMVVLYSLTLALGMLVDNAVVVVENIYRHMQQGVPRLRAAMQATSEVAMPIVGATMTTLAAFFPVIFWPGIMGEFMSYLPITLIVTLSSSLFVALVINPALCSLFMKAKGAPEGAMSPEEVVAAGEKPADITGPVLRRYAALLRAALRHRAVVLTMSFLFLIALIQVWLVSVGLEKPVEFFPDIEPRNIYVNVDMPEGADLDYADRVLKQIEVRISGTGGEALKVPDVPLDKLYAEAMTPKKHMKAGGEEFHAPGDLENVTDIYSKAVSTSGATSSFEPTAPNHVAVQFLDFEDRTRSTNETLDEISERVRDVPGGKITVQKQEEGPPTGAPINIEISGDDFKTLGYLAGAVREVLEKMPHVEDIRDDYLEGAPTVRVRVDRQRAALFGLSTDTIGFALKTGYSGMNVSTFREAGEDYDITVQLSEPERRVTDVLRELLIPAPNGQLVPLRSLASIEYSGSLGNVTRINNERTVTVKANVDETKIPGPVARAQAEEMLKEFAVPPGYKTKFTGEFEFQQEAEDFLSKAFVVGLLMIALILVTIFNSVSQPFIIMATVLLSLGGAFLGLTVAGSPFGIIMSGVGVISLAGVVVNNGIILVDYINKLRERGMSVSEAVVSGGATRLRPVLLTAVTTILGLVPMVTGVSFDFHKMAVSWSSESSQWWSSMAIVVIFGLMVATFLTLIVVPVLYSVINSISERRGPFFQKARRLYWKPYERLTGESMEREAGNQDG